MEKPHLLTNSESKLPRRGILGAAAGAIATGAAIKAGLNPLSPRTAEAANQGPSHLVWVWQFSADAEPNFIGAVLRDHGLGIVLKTHDGVEWMSKYDDSIFAVSGPLQAQVLARYFEDAGVPFHGWAVIKGSNPVQEA